MPDGWRHVINWPYKRRRFNLEAAPTLRRPHWSNVLDPLEIISGQNYTTNSPASSATFYRLRLRLASGVQ